MSVSKVSVLAQLHFISRKLRQNVNSRTVTPIQNLYEPVLVHVFLSLSHLGQLLSVEFYCCLSDHVE